jgi:hypothetical protein
MLISKQRLEDLIMSQREQRRLEKLVRICLAKTVREVDFHLIEQYVGKSIELYNQIYKNPSQSKWYWEEMEQQIKEKLKIG